jgi:NifU-like protein
MDGGGMDIMDIDGINVLIRYHGACGNCHISQTGTLAFIQQTLQQKVDPRIQVVVV